jgi:3-mercaptopyruvate sulfurtransferase SseA
LDLRPAEQFAAGHLPGAAHVDLWGVSLIDTDSAPMRAFLWMIVHVLETRGVDGRVPVVVYDEQSGLRAARAFWFLEYFGHPNTRLLDGGYTAWVRADLPVATVGRNGLEVVDDAGTRNEERGTSGVQAPSQGFGRLRRASAALDEARRAESGHPGRSSKSEVRGTPPTREKADWNGGEPRAIPERVATWRDVRDRLGRADVVLLDTRSDGEYCGTVVRANRGGAIPGAVHLEWTRNLGPDGAFKPADELRAMYEQAGVTPDKEVVTYCQGGYRAAHAYLALRLIGYPRVRNYIGSWKEWGDREELPIEVPTQP